MKIIGYLLISLFLLGCSNTNSDITLIRVKNISQFDFEDIIVNTSGGENNYGNVISNEVTEYKTFDFAYPYAFIELKIDNNTYTIQPIIEYLHHSTYRLCRRNTSNTRKIYL